MNQIYCGDAVEVMRGWPAACVDMVMTSPPYWGLRSYNWGGDAEKCREGKAIIHRWRDEGRETVQSCSRCGARRPRYGIEPTLEEYIEKTVEIFRQVKRVLKDWGMLWLNMGDAYASSKGMSFNPGGGAGNLGSRIKEAGAYPLDRGSVTGLREAGLKPGDLIGLPWRVVSALQADGWWLRDDVIWCKAWSFHDCGRERIVENGVDLFGDEFEDVIYDGASYVGSTMPESVNGWRWEKHKVKTKAGSVPRRGQQSARGDVDEIKCPTAQWVDCPGCPKCEGNGGYVLRKGSWRPTKAHEYLFMLAKSEDYYCDAEAVKEAGVSDVPFAEDVCGQSWHNHERDEEAGQSQKRRRAIPISGRNLRDVWCINPQPYKGAHYATFPEKLVEPCIKAGTSQKGNCPACGLPWVRVIDTEKIRRERPRDRTDRHSAGDGVNSCGNTVAGVHNTTIAWRAACACKDAGRPLPAVVLDPFMGSGTVALMAQRLGRNYVGIEINPEYVERHARPRLEKMEPEISRITRTKSKMRSSVKSAKSAVKGVSNGDG